jgi:hypothetical protein
MDGKGREMDNAWIERFGKYLKYDYIYLNHEDDGIELYSGDNYHIEYKNQKTITPLNKYPMNAMKNPLKKQANKIFLNPKP